MIDMGYRARDREFHLRVSDGTLDLYARHCGSPSGIGRLCLLDDRVLAEIVRAAHMSPGASVLDVGCGRGFLARWLRWYDVDFKYLGVDDVPEAIAAARRNAPYGEYTCASIETLNLQCTFDRVFAVEAAADGLMTAGIAASITKHLTPGGKFAVTLLSLDGGHDEKIRRSIDLLADTLEVDEVRDLSPQVREYASTMYSAFLLGAWDTAIKTEMCVDAVNVLHALEWGAFNYTMVTGTRRAAA